MRSLRPETLDAGEQALTYIALFEIKCLLSLFLLLPGRSSDGLCVNPRSLQYLGPVKHGLRTNQDYTLLPLKQFSGLVLPPSILISYSPHVLTAALGQETMALSFSTQYEELLRAQADGWSPGCARSLRSSCDRGDDFPPSDLASHLNMASVFLCPGRNLGELHRGV